MTLSKADRLSIIASAGAAGLYGMSLVATVNGPVHLMCLGCSMDIDAFLEGHDGAGPIGVYGETSACGDRPATAAEVLAWLGYR